MILVILGYKEKEEARVMYADLKKARLSLLQQKVKQSWLQSGDSNPAFFHACLRKRSTSGKMLI